MNINDSIEELDDAIAKLKAKKDKLISEKRGVALEQAKKLVKQFKFTSTELEISVKSFFKRASPKMKYQSPWESTAKWSGRGKAPSWMQQHLDTGGKKEDLLIKKLPLTDSN
jgi:DNA-binding protein H-NS